MAKIHRLTALAIIDPDAARAEMRAALDAAHGTVRDAARALGMSARSWYFHCERLGLELPSQHPRAARPNQPRK